MELDAALDKRHSVRAFTSKKPSWKEVLYALDAAMQAPFAGNTNNLRFIVIEHPETIAMLAQQSEQSWMQDAGIVIVVCANEEQLTRLYNSRGSAYSHQQAGAAIQNLLLKLTDLGLGACWVGAFDEPALKSRLQIPKAYQIEALIPIGHTDTKKVQKRVRKRAMTASLYWEVWDQRRRPALFREAPKHHTEILSMR